MSKKLIIELRGYVKPYKHKGKELPYLISKKGQVFNKNTGQELKYYLNSNNYYGVSLYNKDKKRSRFYAVHRMVAETFIPNPAQFEVVNHLDNNHLNNDVNNLEWTTQSENLKYAHNQGRTNNKSGEECHLTKYPDSQIRKVCELLQAGYRNKDVAKMTGVEKSYVSSIRNREWRKDISKDYTWETIKFEDRRGSNAAGATIDEEVAKKICKLIQKGLGNKEIADKIGEPCKWWHVRNIRSRKNWIHVSKKYKW